MTLFDAIGEEGASVIHRLMSPPPGEVARDEALARVEEHAQAEWLAAAEAVVRGFEPGAEFCTDFVWSALAVLDVKTHEPRALGAVMRKLGTKGVVRNTGQYVKSTRPECHARPIPVWVRL